MTHVAAIGPDAVIWLRGHWQFVLSLALMVITLVVGVPWIFLLKREVTEDEGPVTEADVLTELEQAHAKGELDDAELRRIRELLARSGDPGAKPPRRAAAPQRRGRESPPRDGGGAPPLTDATEPPADR